MQRVEWARMLVAVLLLGSAASAADLPTLSGVVKDSKGIPQMGALVEILSSVSRPITAFSDDRGHFSVTGLFPGKYSVRASAPSFLPSLREDLVLREGAHLVVAMTLNTLIEAMQLLPPGRGADEESDDWKWTLRSAANRPILRVLDDGPLVVVSRSENEDDRVLKARVEFLATSDAGTTDPAAMATAFNFEEPLHAGGQLRMSGSVAPDSGTPESVLQATYRHDLPDGEAPEISMLWRQFAAADSGSGLSVMTMRARNTLPVTAQTEVRYGGETDVVQSGSTQAVAYRPSVSVADHLNADTVVEYAYTSSRPDFANAAGADSFAGAEPLPAAETADAGPRFALSSHGAVLERAAHQELSVSHRAGANTLQVAAFYDRVGNTALDGTGSFGASDADEFINVAPGRFRVNGGPISTEGVRLVYARRVSRRLTATFDIANGGVLATSTMNTASPEGATLAGTVRNLRAERQFAYTMKLSGEVPQSGTSWVSSYGLSRGDALTAVDMFNSSPGEADPFWNLFVRQPVPACRVLAGRVEVMVDVRNLLAQGYHPVLGADGRTVYLVQSARAVRGGVAFVF